MHKMFDFCFIAIMPEHGFFKLKLPGSDLDINAIQVWLKVMAYTMFYANIILLIMIPKMFQSEVDLQPTDALQKYTTLQNIME